MNIEDRELKNLIIINIIVIMYWIILICYRHIIGRDLDKLAKPIVYKCDGWCLSHITYFMIIGYLSPKYWLYMTIVGILFEFVELYLKKFTPYIKAKIITDPMINTLGLIIGLILFKLFPNTIDLYKLITFH